MEQIGEADPAEQFRTNAIRNAVDDFGAILGRVDMNAEWPFAEGHVDDPRNRPATSLASASGGSRALSPLSAMSGMSPVGPSAYSAARAVSAGVPAWAKWLVPFV